jgi:hypothetical protein
MSQKYKRLKVSSLQKTMSNIINFCHTFKRCDMLNICHTLNIDYQVINNRVITVL